MKFIMVYSFLRPFGLLIFIDNEHKVWLRLKNLTLLHPFQNSFVIFQHLIA